MPFLDPELIHADEGVGIFALKNLPLRKAYGGSVIRKPQSVGESNLRIYLKPQKGQIIFAEKRIDAGQSHAMFLNMEEQIPAGADAEEI